MSTVGTRGGNKQRRKLRTQPNHLPTSRTRPPNQSEPDRPERTTMTTVTRTTTQRRPGTPGTGTTTVQSPTQRRRPGTPRALMNIRADINARIAAGEHIECRRCHTAIRPGDKWELGHPTDRPYASGNIADDLAPEHATCNKTGLIADQPPTFTW